MFKYIKSFTILSAKAFIVIAESSINMMCVGILDEIELPEEIKNTEF